MSGVPNVFGSATSSIPLSQLDVNFNTPLYIGNTSVGLGNTVTSFGNVTLTNTTISGLSGGTANGVVYINSSNVAVASPTVLAFDGSNLGLGVTLSPWSGSTAIQSTNGVALSSINGSNNTQLTSNAYWNGSAWTYIANAYATKYSQTVGAHSWYVAPSSTGAITFTQAMTLNNSGTLTFNQSGQGIQFTNSSALTNSTFNDYETGTWTPSDASGASLSLTLSGSQVYTKIGNMVIASFSIVYPSTANATGNLIGGLPFATGTNNNFSGGAITLTTYTTPVSLLAGGSGATSFSLRTFGNTQPTNANLSGLIIRGNLIYTAQF